MQSKWLSILLVVAAILVIAVQPAAAVSTTVVISEFRTRGPGLIGDGSDAADDQFIELYNLSPVSVDITGYIINTWDATYGDMTGIAQLGSGGPVILGPYEHYLIVNGFGYSGGTAPDDSFFLPILADAVGIALVAADGTTVVDAVSTTSDVGNPYFEGTSLAAMTLDNDQSYERLPATPGIAPNNGHINTEDTDDNSADFTFNAVSSNPESQAEGSPTAVVLRDLRVQAQSPAVWLPVAVLLVLGGTLLVSRRRRRA